MEKQTPQQIVDQLQELPEGTRFQVLAPVVRGRKGEFVDLFKELSAKGFSRAKVDGKQVQLSEPPKLGKQYKHTIEVVVDRLVAKDGIHQRLTDSVETALALAEGRVLADFVDLDEEDPGRPVPSPNTWRARTSTRWPSTNRTALVLVQ